MTAEQIARALGGHKSGRSWMARCPAHQDKTPSLSISDRDGKVLVHCFTGCSQDEVIAGLRARGLWPDPKQQPQAQTQATREQRQFEALVKRHLVDAWLWRRAAIAYSEDLMDSLKAALSDPEFAHSFTDPRFDDLGKITRWWRRIEAWRRMENGELVAQYPLCKKHHAQLTAALVRAAHNLEVAELRALRKYLATEKRTDDEAVA